MTETTGRFISTQSVVLAVNLHVPHLPDRGSSIRAQAAVSLPGGGFTTLAVVAEEGVSANLAAPMGTGPNSFAVRHELTGAHINSLTDVLVGDIGVAVVLVETSGNTTTLVTAGVESEPTLASLESIDLAAGDLVHIHGSDLTSDAAEVLASWGSSLPEEVTLVLAISPSVDDVPASIWQPLLARADVVTMNIREAAALGAVLEAAMPGTGIRHILRPDAAIVRRLGEMGCEVQENIDSSTVQLEAFQTRRVDTSGVGDTHVGAMCAGLLSGLSLIESCRRANAASALMLSHESNLPVPSRREIDHVLKTGTAI